MTMFEKETKEYEKRISEECLKTILDSHQHWLNEDCEGWENMRANLNGVDLSHVDLSYVNLSYANLNGANLSYANLNETNLNEANLNGANLNEANLSEANLNEASLIKANLSGASLIKTNLNEANLKMANLSHVDLSGASLLRANLIWAKNVPYIPMVCPEEGSFIGWKKAKITRGHEVIVKLRIPFDAKRSSATTRKCRCSKAEVIAIYNLDGTEAGETTCHSDYDNSFIYEVGKTVEVTNFSEDRWEECAKGIHFFINKQEAINY
jgi:hypothetical protein